MHGSLMFSQVWCQPAVLCSCSIGKPDQWRQYHSPQEGDGDKEGLGEESGVGESSCFFISPIRHRQAGHASVHSESCLYGLSSMVIRKQFPLIINFFEFLSLSLLLYAITQVLPGQNLSA